MAEAVEPRRLRKLLEILTEHGVTKYEDGTLKVEMGSDLLTHIKPREAGVQFDMDNYDPGSGNGHDQDAPISPRLSDEEAMFPGYSMRQGD